MPRATIDTLTTAVPDDTPQPAVPVMARVPKQQSTCAWALAHMIVRQEREAAQLVTLPVVPALEHEMHPAGVAGD